MKFKLHREHGSLNSKPVFDAFEQGVNELGYKLSGKPGAIPVIWSVLWHGRMAKNQQIYQEAKRQGLPVVIIEVGNLRRGITWRISLDNINGLGKFGNDENLDPTRSAKLGVRLSPCVTERKTHILITGQHQRSLQWEICPPMTTWIHNQILEIRKNTDREIVVRPHPRSKFTDAFRKLKNVRMEMPVRVPNTYDDFNIDYNCHCVINFNSGPAIQAAIQGVPVICDQSSLAYPVSDSIDNINEPCLPDRSDWFLKLCHTEWTIDEIAQGIPLQRLIAIL